MTNTTLIVSRRAFDKALAEARKLGPAGEVTGLAAGLDAGLMGSFDDAWDKVEEALRTGFVYGREKGQALISAAIRSLESVVAQAGSKTREVHELVLARSHQFVQTLFLDAVGRVPEHLAVGRSDFQLSNLRLSHKINASGSIEFNLIAVFKVASSGELEVQAEYSRSTSDTAKPPVP